ncbi:MAG: nuclear transport factor 2 family protein, partial [Pseudomonadota bacterium]
MTRILKTKFASVVVASAIGTQVAGETSAGTPITMDNLVANADMIRISDSIDAAVDAKDWALTRSFFTDEIHVDFTSLV